MNTTLQTPAETGPEIGAGSGSEVGRAKRLKAATTQAHDQLDKRIMAGEPFAALANYGRFLAVQHAFHRDIDALYDDPAIAALVPDLAERRRFAQIGQDLADLSLAPAEQTEAPRFAGGEIDVPTALGWLYVAEGSNLGAAFLFKMARALGLDENHGARHLAGHPDGRAQHWRSFTGALDEVALDEAEEMRVIEGANAAFRRVHGLVEQQYG
ncbi:heme oxygenase [Novosphingobium sp. PhB57]|uniref:biliverdin-producing heme oxygenase n=1 Tax=Novosphingobium sp. PhB57 TaxID=2485107 RepID=UPI0010502FD4|nr:biliverdin-producing heme oxygenase [Novosphingobium sp. PhB57]TCU58703.1 heme oxygenase [Novosphingobium sp. PhB57]